MTVGRGETWTGVHLLWMQEDASNKSSTARVNTLAKAECGWGTAQNPWGKRHLRSPHTPADSFFTRLSQTRSKRAPRSPLCCSSGQGKYSHVWGTRHSTLPGPPLPSSCVSNMDKSLNLRRVGRKGKTAYPWTVVNNHCRWERERRNDGPGRGAELRLEPAEAAWGRAAEWRRPHPHGQGHRAHLQQSLNQNRDAPSYSPPQAEKFQIASNSRTPLGEGQ